MQDAGDLTRFRDLTLAEFVDRLASPEPIPGGGSVAAVAASLGAALVSMVASLSIGRDRYAQHSDNLREAVAMGRDLSRRLLELAEDDALAYNRYLAALKRPKDTDEQRAARSVELADAARRAAEVPLGTLRACLEVASTAERIAGRSNANAASDLSVAALLADAAAHAAGANVLVNLPAVEDPDWTEEVARTVLELQEAVENVAQVTREVVGSRATRAPISPNAGAAVEVEA